MCFFLGSPKAPGFRQLFGAALWVPLPTTWLMDTLDSVSAVWRGWMFSAAVIRGGEQCSCSDRTDVNSPRCFWPVRLRPPASGWSADWGISGSPGAGVEQRRWTHSQTVSHHRVPLTLTFVSVDGAAQQHHRFLRLAQRAPSILHSQSLQFQSYAFSQNQFITFATILFTVT